MLCFWIEKETPIQSVNNYTTLFPSDRFVSSWHKNIKIIRSTPGGQTRKQRQSSSWKSQQVEKVCQRHKEHAIGGPSVRKSTGWKNLIVYTHKSQQAVSSFWHFKRWKDVLVLTALASVIDTSDLDNFGNTTVNNITQNSRTAEESWQTLRK